MEVVSESLLGFMKGKVFVPPSERGCWEGLNKSLEVVKYINFNFLLSFNDVYCIF